MRFKPWDQFLQPFDGHFTFDPFTKGIQIGHFVAMSANTMGTGC